MSDDQRGVECSRPMPATSMDEVRSWTAKERLDALRIVEQKIANDEAVWHIESTLLYYEILRLRGCLIDTLLAMGQDMESCHALAVQPAASVARGEGKGE